jgi:hypothetical protein
VRPQRLDDARLALKEGVPDADWLRERGVSIVYSAGRIESPELVQVHDRVYVLPDAEVCAPTEVTDSVRSAQTP